jgi:hypothetical protein
MKVELRFDPNYGHVLVKDDKESFCPFQQVVPTQGIGGMGLMRLPCSSICPKAKVKKLELDEKYEYEYSVLCGCEPIKYKIAKKEETDTTTNLIIK